MKSSGYRFYGIKDCLSQIKNLFFQNSRVVLSLNQSRDTMNIFIAFFVDCSCSCDVQAAQMSTHKYDGKYLRLLPWRAWFWFWVFYSVLHRLWADFYASYQSQVQSVPADEASSRAGRQSKFTQQKKEQALTILFFIAVETIGTQCR